MEVAAQFCGVISGESHIINPQVLTEDEAELYDRQIRLWGLESQKRLRTANVLIIGMHGLGCEVAKNLILAGIRSLTLLDDGVVTENDRSGLFLMPLNVVGSNRAEASVRQCQQLNPMVQVTADVNNVQDKPDLFFCDFDVVFATKCSVHELGRIDAACRQNNTLFFCADVFGIFGFMFLDLNVHTFALDTVTFIEGVVGKVTTKNTSKFTSFQDAYGVDWKSEVNAKRIEKMDPCYFLMKVLLRFRGEQGRDPSPDSRVEDTTTLRKLCAKELAQMDIPIEKVPDNLLLQSIAEVSPICAILGGVASQEIIKCLMQKEPPLNNFFFFNPLKCVGFEDHVGPYPE